MKIAIAQLNTTIGDINGNSQLIIDAAKRATGAHCQILLTPELSLCGYPPRDLLMHDYFVEAMNAGLQELAVKLPPALAVLVGTVARNTEAPSDGGKPLFNSIALLRNGKVEQMFHKRLLPTYDVFDENRYFESALASKYLTIKLEKEIKIGVSICEDLWNDEYFWGKRSYKDNPIADLSKMGVELVVNLSASPYSINKQELREAMLQHSAKHYSRPIIYVNQVGGNDDIVFDGSSFALNSKGELLGRAKAFEPDFMVISFNEKILDLEAPEAVQLTPLAECSEAEIWSALVLGVRDYARKCGFNKIVLGLSGGIDSSLVAAIASAAIGPENVLGVLMPSPYSSDHSVKDALLLAENLGMTAETITIGDLMSSYDRTLEKMFAGTASGVAEENIQSRIRGNLLMAIANKFGHLLVSTGNKSEMAVGYCTLYGDMNGGLAVISDLPKTSVYSVCRWLNAKSQKEVIPENILTKPPSAELKPGQVDQDSLPPYDILDDILHRLIENHESEDQIVAAGHDLSTVNRIRKMVKRAEFKRRQAPPGLKITQRAFGTGWRMPIASYQ
ncbi:MAG: NAD+ synthase [Hormoscilla sp. SP5CHS1]|nr:NAD+ synthase [Hormoscilla sp. SP12CHS1]MBC6454973.1 NAD+ synthase [Hormoscilla sp. SP5CHS1]